MIKKMLLVCLLPFVLFAPLTALSKTQEITFEIEGMD